MQLKFLESIAQPSSPGLCKVTAICWAPNGKKLAVCTADRVVMLFDENGVKKDKFSTKPADKGPKNYIVRQMAFSPQSDKLAIAQSDNMVFVYKIGVDWGEKKSICNKFQHSSSITTLIWPVGHANEIVYGLAEGQVKLGQMKTHRPVTLYNADSYVLALSSGSDGSGFVSSHVDGSIYVYYYDAGDRGARRIARHSCPPFALSWGTSIIVAGNDGKIVFYDSDGSEEQTLDISSGDERREYTCAVSNPTGDSVVLGSFDRLTAVTKSRETMNWEVSGTVNVENLYSVSAMDWKPDGDKVAVGNICGVVDLYDVCIKRALYKGGFELTYVSSSQIIIRQVDSNLRIVLRSRYNREILKTNIYQSRFVIAHTSDTLLLGDLETLKVSEIPWRGIELGEKFIFDNPSACIIHCAGELSIIEYGIDDILGTVRTSFISSHVISLRINERKRKVSHQADADNKKIAFLLDAQTVCIKDMCSQVTVQVSHDSKIDWLELNGRGDLLLFRDKKRYLHVFNLQTQTRHQLLSFCTYVQWVPNSDVIVSQSRSNMCVWYNVGAPDQVTAIPIKGDIEDIERTEGKTEVIVDEGINQALYPLDEALISFSTAIEDGEHFKAMELLDKLVLSPDVEAMWRQLRSASLSAGEVKIAQRCSAALGDITASKFLGNICDMGRYAEQDLKINRDDYYQVRCNLALLEKDYRAAEDILVNQGKIDECIELYQKLQRHEDAIRVAQQNKHPDLHDMRRAYFQYLLDTNQYENAAVLKATESDFTQAVDLFLKGGMPGKAAQVLLDHDIQQPMSLLDKVANALVRSGMHDIAGEFFERQNDLPRALESYIRGNAFRKAVDLARKSFPARVVELQEAWGDYLVSIKQIDMAINHYIEAKVNRKAIDAALNARQYSRALQLVDAIDRETARPFYRQLARHYEETRQYDLAQKCYVEGDQAQLAVEMHTKVGNWELAHSIAKKHMREEEVSMLYISQAQKLEAKGRLKDAEKLYLAVKEKDLAVNMYKKHKLYDDMIRLVQEYMPETLKESHKFLATTLEMEGLYKDAEHHYVEAQEWHGAVNMYRHIEQWDDAIRVAKFHGGIGACKRVTIALLMAVGTVEGAKYLIKHGLVEAAIDHAAENGAYDLALELATQQMPKKLPDVYLKHALLLEDDEKFDKAEEEFLKAGKPKEAIDMYLHQHDWENALRVAENFDSSSVPAVFLAHAAVCVESKDFSKAEELFLAASRPDLALSMYQDAEMLPDAIRIAQKYLPHRAAELNASFNTSQARAGKASVKTDFMVIGRSMEQSKQWAQALEVYLSARAGKVDPSIDVEELWERAVEIARKYVTNRYVEVGVEVSRRLVDIKKEEAAADLLFEVGRQDEAINLCIQSRKFDKAKSLAKGNAMLKKKVDEAYQGFLITREDTKELVEMGHSEDALNVLVKRGDWDGLWSMASKENVSQSTLSKYVLMRVEELLGSANVNALDEAVQLLNRQFAPANESAVSVYRQLVIKLFLRSNKKEGSEYISTFSSLRDILFNVANKLRTPDKKLQGELLHLLMAVHYQSILFTAKRLGLKEIAAKCAITMLKYPEFIPADKAYYQAGNLCRELGGSYTNLAFMLLNRYVDIAEAIDTADPSLLDSSEFSETDAVPPIENLPKNHYLSDEDDREEVRTWVLSIVTDSNVEQRFPGREASKNTLYDGLYNSDKSTCIVTGYPIYPADMLEVNNSTANRRDWNLLVSKTRVCPWTGQPQNPLY